MYAVIKTGGKQYSVKVGDVVYVEKLNAEDNSEVTFDQVLAVGEEGSVKVGAPVVEGATVVAKVVKNGKERVMKDAQTNGDCNHCHSEKGDEKAPGRIMAP